MSDEDKEIAAAFADTAGELSAGRGGGADGEQPVKPAVEVGTVLGEGSVLEIGAAAADGNGALQQLVKARSEASVSGVGGVLGVAQQMGEAQLALVSMSGLCRIAVGNPDIGLASPRKSVSTAAPRLSAIRWWMAVEESSTHCHQFFPSTRAEVSSEATTLLRARPRRWSRRLPSATFGRGPACWQWRPSLRRTPNTSSSSRTSRSKPIAWVTCRCRISGTSRRQKASLVASRQAAAR